MRVVRTGHPDAMTGGQRVGQRRTTGGGLALLAAVALGAAPLAGCGEDSPAAPAPGEASTGVPLNVGSEEPVATATDVAP